jgi:hypothetical protein
LRVDDVAPHGYAIDRDNVRQGKTARLVRFDDALEIAEKVDV